MATANEFEALAEKQTGQIFELLREPSWKQQLTFWRARPRDAELRKLLGRIHTAIGDARRLEAKSSGGLDVGAKERARQLLDVDPRGLNLDTALEVIHGWDQLLIESGDERYVRDLLAAEFPRDKIDTTATTWSDVFGESPRKEESDVVSVGKPLDLEILVAARTQLMALYRTRSTLYDLHRARQGMRVRHLWLLSPVLLALIAGFALLISLAGGDWHSILLAAVAGGLGAALSGTRKLRDHVRNINDLRAFSPSVIVQPLLGAAAGLLLLLVLESGLFDIDWGGSDWAAHGALAFVAGFSEPFFLGIVGRVAEIGKPWEEQPAASSGGEDTQ